MKIDIALQASEGSTKLAVFVDGKKERQTINPKAFSRSGYSIPEPGEIVELEFDGQTQHRAAYLSLIAALRYVGIHKDADIRVLTNNPTIARHLNGQWKVNDELKALFNAAKELMGKAKIVEIAPERMANAFKVEE